MAKQSSKNKKSSSSKKQDKKSSSSQSSEWTQQYMMDPQTHEMVAVGLPSGRSDGQDMVQEWDRSWEAARTE
ncbi:hypothetical protein TruAng_006855 [Truncatella angustata]|nr:hypothetical protein TruAng_006855 [Truncatella angustata]